MNRRRNAFTLLELMVCLVIIGFVGVLVGVKGRELLLYHQFRANSQTFLLDLNRWRFVSMAFNCDVSCTLSQTTQGTEVSWKPDAKIQEIPSGLHYFLKGVKDFKWEGKAVKEFSFTAFSSGRLSSTGVLSLIPAKDEEAVNIDFSFPFSLQEKVPSLSLLQKNDRPSYPERKREKNPYSF